MNGIYLLGNVSLYNSIYLLGDGCLRAPRFTGHRPVERFVLYVVKTHHVSKNVNVLRRFVQAVPGTGRGDEQFPGKKDGFRSENRFEAPGSEGTFFRFSFVFGDVAGGTVFL